MKRLSFVARKYSECSLSSLACRAMPRSAMKEADLTQTGKFEYLKRSFASALPWGAPQ